MLLTQNEFETRLKNQSLRIALIGMSNIGKSHWARRFKKKHGFEHYEVDDRIQDELELSSISESADWMGHPFEDGYQGKAKTYLALEEKLTRKALELDGNIVLDTTGSVIHLDKEILSDLCKNYLVIYLAARPHDLERLIARFETSPKPLIWGDHYKTMDGMSDAESMMSLYPSLLEMRDCKYGKLADVELKSRYVSNKTQLLGLVKQALPLA